MDVGFVGLGTMGGNVATNLLRAGFLLTVYDLRPQAMEPLLARGASAGSGPADVLDRCDVVVTLRVDGSWAASWEVTHPADPSR